MVSNQKLKQAISLLKKNLDAQDLSISQALETLESALKQREISAQPDHAQELTSLPVPEIEKGQIAAYSDGACRGNPGPGAWAFVIQTDDGALLHEDFATELLTTNNRMELKGVIMGLQFLLEKGYQARQIVYFTDSRYVVDGITKWIAGWKARGWKKADKKTPENLELWQRLDELNGQLRVKYVWVKGHAGHEQNEYCDRLANKALDEQGH